MRATLVQPGNQAVPEGRDARTVTDTVDAEFTPHLDSPITATVAEQEARRVRDEVARLDGVRAVAESQPVGEGLALVQATPVDEPLSPAAQDTARSVRSIARTPEGESRVGGPTAEFIDFKQSLLDHAPLVAALIFTSTMILLFLLTGSLILPFKTLVMNVLSIAAAFGLLVIVFQDELGSELFALRRPERDRDRAACRRRGDDFRTGHRLRGAGTRADQGVPRRRARTTRPRSRSESSAPGA